MDVAIAIVYYHTSVACENISALHMACGFGDVEAVKKMVHKTMSSESLNRMDLDRKTPLEYALAIKHKEIIANL